MWDDSNVGLVMLKHIIIPLHIISTAVGSKDTALLSFIMCVSQNLISFWKTAIDSEIVYLIWFIFAAA